MRENATAEEGAISVGWVPGRAGRGCLLCVWISRASVEWSGRARHDFGCISGHLGARRRLLLVHESSGVVVQNMQSQTHQHRSPGERCRWH
jgi:hypothetical protein